MLNMGRGVDLSFIARSVTLWLASIAGKADARLSFPRCILLRLFDLPKRIKPTDHRVRWCAYLHQAAVYTDRMKAGG